MNKLSIVALSLVVLCVTAHAISEIGVTRGPGAVHLLSEGEWTCEEVSRIHFKVTGEVFLHFPDGAVHGVRRNTKVNYFPNQRCEGARAENF